MRQPSLRPLIGPVALTLLGFSLRAAAPLILGWLGLEAGAPLGTVLRDLAGTVFWLGLAWAGARLFDLLLLRAAQAARRPSPYPRLLGDLVRAVLFAAAGVAILLLVFDQPALGLVTTSGVAVAVVGFALRYVISDIFSGIALGIEQPYRIGDWIETAQGCAGRVTEVSWRATRLVTRDGVTLLVPNGLIAAHRLVNWGAAADGRYRVALRVALDPALPPERAKRVLLAGALDAGRDFPALAPDVILQELADGVASYLVRFHVADYGREAACRDAVAAAVLRALLHAGLGIARPLRDLRLERPAPPPARPRRDALLRRVPLFRGFPAAQQEELAQRMQERVFAAGDTVVRQGEPGSSLFVLAEGALDVRLERDGAESVIDLMVPGDVFGEMSLLTGQPRSSTVAAATGAVAFEIDREHLDPILRRQPELAERLAAMMAARQARNAGLRRDAGLPAEAEPPHNDLLGRLKAFFNLGGG